MDARSRLRLMMTATALIALGGCAAKQVVQDPQVVAYEAAASAYSTASARAYEAQTSVGTWDVGAPLTVEQQQAARDLNARVEAAAAAEHRARAEYQAQMANVTTPGLLRGFLTGLGAGQTCINYYRNIGVIR